MKKKKLYIFNKEILLKIIVVVLLFISLGLFCFIDNKINAYSSDMVSDTPIAYPILNYDRIVVYNVDSYFTIDLPNSIYAIQEQGRYTNQLIPINDGSEACLVQLDRPTPYGYNVWIQGFTSTYYSIQSDLMYIPPNITDYYSNFNDSNDVWFMTLGSGQDFDVTISLSFDFLPIGTLDIQHYEQSETYSYNSVFTATPFMDTDMVYVEGGGVVTNYKLTFAFDDPISINQFTLERISMEDLPATLLYPYIITEGETCPTDIDLTDFLVNSIGGFMDFQIFPGFSIAGMLSTILAVGLFILFLKVFAGG